MRGMKLLVAAMALTFAAGALGADAKAPAPEVKRNILDRHDQSGVDGKEIVVGTAEFPKGGAIGYHTHDGDEAGYVLKGELVWRVKGQPDKTLKAGDHFFNPRGSAHSLIAAPGGDGGMAYSTWIIDKGKPLATPIKD
ncbi:MAG TPA: cupin domain-containing protein [Rudaea sp.]|nr:cupin domain-containing protein [Rudaea sp.]